MKKRIITVLSVVSLILATAIPNAMATLISTTRLQDVLNTITTAPTPGTSSVNVNTDQIANDAQWAISGSGASVSTFVIELGAYAPSNTFGIYQGTSMVQVFNGAQSTGAQALISIMADGSVIKNFVDTGVDFIGGNRFGFYITTPQDLGYTYYSETSKNSDGFDHMVAFQGKGDTVKIGSFSPGIWSSNEYVLAWEDLNSGGDKDYEDLVVMVESVNPVPEPATLLLMGAGLVGLGIFGRKKIKA